VEHTGQLRFEFQTCLPTLKTRLKFNSNIAFVLFWLLRTGRDKADFLKFFLLVISQEGQEVLKWFGCHIKDKVMEILLEF
jgi:hypothetical protein